MSATQPTATTASAASALSRVPSFEKTIRTPLGVFSKDSMMPKFSRTTMPDSRKAAATAADTSSSSVVRMRGPAWKSWTREPKALKIEATCTPVAPAAHDQHRRRDRGQAPGIAVGGGQLEAGDWKPPARAARAKDELVSLQAQSTLGFDGVRIDEARSAGLFMDRHSQPVQVLAPKRMRAHGVDDLAHAREQPGIFEHRLAYGDAVVTELASFSDQPGSMGQCANRHRSVIGRHAAELVAGDERCPRAQLCRTARGNTPAGPAPITMTSIMFLLAD